MQAKKVTEAAVTMPSTPSGANGLRLPESNAVTPSARKSASTASLMNTMIVFVRALSRMPRERTAVTARTMNTAGRLNRAAVARRAGQRVGQYEAEPPTPTRTRHSASSSRGSSQRRERLDVDPVERDDGDGGAGLLGSSAAASASQGWSLPALAATTMC